MRNPRHYRVTYYRSGDCTGYVVQVVARTARLARRFVRAEWCDVVAITASRVP